MSEDLRSDIEALVSGNVLTCDSRGLWIEYDSELSSAQVHDRAAHDIARVLARVEGMAVADGPANLIRQGTGRWLVVQPWRAELLPSAPQMPADASE